MQDNYIFGIRAVIEAVKSEKTLDKVFIQRGVRGDLLQELKEVLQQKQFPISYVPIEKLNRITKKNHQGVVAVASPIEFYPLEEMVVSAFESGKTPLFLVLDHLTDVRNLGAIIRTAECTGVSGIILPKKGGASLGGDAVKTSAGAIFNVPICKVENLKDAIYFLQSSGVKVVGATEKTSQLIYNESFTEPVALVMGAEDTGISAGLLKILDARAKLPMFGQIGSLNVSIACGAFLYEIVRQRNL